MKVMKEILKELTLIRKELQAIHRELESSKKMNGEEMDRQLGECYKQSSADPYRMVGYLDGRIIGNIIVGSGVLSELLRD